MPRGAPNQCQDGRAVHADYAEPEPLRQLLVTAELILARQIRHYSRVAAALSF